MMNVKGTTLAKHNFRCHRCGRGVGPNYPIKMMYVQQGAGAGYYCSNTCCLEAYTAVTDAHPELKSKPERVFGGGIK